MYQRRRFGWLVARCVFFSLPIRESLRSYAFVEAHAIHWHRRAREVWCRVFRTVGHEGKCRVPRTYHQQQRRRQQRKGEEEIEGKSERDGRRKKGGLVKERRVDPFGMKLLFHWTCYVIFISAEHATSRSPEGFSFLSGYESTRRWPGNVRISLLHAVLTCYPLHQCIRSFSCFFLKVYIRRPATRCGDLDFSIDFLLHDRLTSLRKHILDETWIVCAHQITIYLRLDAHAFHICFGTQIPQYYYILYLWA